jgi:hypothetical protein
MGPDALAGGSSSDKAYSYSYESRTISDDAGSTPADWSKPATERGSRRALANCCRALVGVRALAGGAGARCLARRGGGIGALQRNRCRAVRCLQLVHSATSATATKGFVMSAPFIFIATNRLREGKLAAERDRAADLGFFVEKNEPQLLAFNEYVNEDRTEVGVVQIHPDAASMEFHMGVVTERAARAYAKTLEATTSIQVYGVG